MKKLFLSILLVSFAALCCGQQPIEIKGQMSQEKIHFNADSAAMTVLHKDLPSSVGQSPDGINYSLLPDQQFFRGNPFFAGVIFTGLNCRFAPRPSTVFPRSGFTSVLPAKPAGTFFSGAFYSALYVDSLRAGVKDLLVAENTSRVEVHYQDLPNPEAFSNHTLSSPDRHSLLLQRKFQMYKPEKMTVAKLVKAPWSTKGSVIGQLSQNFTSSNWYQGGKSNLAALFVFEGNANYDDGKKVQFDNTFTYRMGIQSENGDTVRGYSVTDNLIRLTSKLGLKAYDNWFYSLSGEFTTYSLTSYTALNSGTKANGFFSPFRLDLGIGMDYKYKKELSVLMTPVSYRYIFFADTVNYAKAAFGVKPGSNNVQEIGSLVRVEYSKKLTDNVDVTTRFSFFTNYHHVEVDWETVTNFVLSRFLSTRLTLHPRFDDSGSINTSRPRIQFKELLSFGFAYKFNNIKAKK
jgi:hypothetical protein